MTATPITGTARNANESESTGTTSTAAASGSASAAAASTTGTSAGAATHSGLGSWLLVGSMVEMAGNQRDEDGKEGDDGRLHCRCCLWGVLVFTSRAEMNYTDRRVRRRLSLFLSVDNDGKKQRKKVDGGRG